MTINGPKIVIENIFPNCYETKEEEDAEYEAYDIDFRSTNSIALNLKQGKVMSVSLLMA